MPREPQLSFQPQVQVPPDPIIERFAEPIAQAYLTFWVLSLFVPIEITSWWRSPASNRAAGGSAGSQHLVGTALDGLSPGLSREQLLPLVALVARYTRVGVPKIASATSGRSVHVQALPAGTVAKILRGDPGLLDRALAFVGPPRGIAI